MLWICTCAATVPYVMVTVRVPVEKPMSCAGTTIFCRGEEWSASLDSSAVPEPAASPAPRKQKVPAKLNSQFIIQKEYTLLFD